MTPEFEFVFTRRWRLVVIVVVGLVAARRARPTTVAFIEMRPKGVDVVHVDVVHVDGAERGRYAAAAAIVAADAVAARLSTHSVPGTIPAVAVAAKKATRTSTSRMGR